MDVSCIESILSIGVSVKENNWWVGLWWLLVRS